MFRENPTRIWNVTGGSPMTQESSNLQGGACSYFCWYVFSPGNTIDISRIVFCLLWSSFAKYAKPLGGKGWFNMIQPFMPLMGIAKNNHISFRYLPGECHQHGNTIGFDMKDHHQTWGLKMLQPTNMVTEMGLSWMITTSRLDITRMMVNVG